MANKMAFLFFSFFFSKWLFWGVIVSRTSLLRPFCCCCCFEAESSLVFLMFIFKSVDVDIWAGKKAHWKIVQGNYNTPEDTSMLLSAKYGNFKLLPPLLIFSINLATRRIWAESSNTELLHNSKFAFSSEFNIDMGTFYVWQPLLRWGEEN